MRASHHYRFITIPHHGFSIILYRTKPSLLLSCNCSVLMPSFRLPILFMPSFRFPILFMPRYRFPILFMPCFRFPILFMPRFRFPILFMPRSVVTSFPTTFHAIIHHHCLPCLTASCQAAFPRNRKLIF